MEVHAALLLASSSLVVFSALTRSRQSSRAFSLQHQVTFASRSGRFVAYYVGYKAHCTLCSLIRHTHTSLASSIWQPECRYRITWVLHDTYRASCSAATSRLRRAHQNRLTCHHRCNTGLGSWARRRPLHVALLPPRRRHLPAPSLCVSLQRAFCLCFLSLRVHRANAIHYVVATSWPTLALPCRGQVHKIDRRSAASIPAGR